MELAERFLQDVLGDYMPKVEKDLIARYLLGDVRALLAGKTPGPYNNRVSF